MVDKVTVEKRIIADYPPTSQKMTSLYQQLVFLGRDGFTLVELIVVVAILAILALLAMPAFNEFVTSAKNKACLSDLHTIDQAITAYVIEKNALPPTGQDGLIAVGFGGKLDPWKREYVYKNRSDADAVPLDDRFFEHLNADYDLYSKGSDGLSDPTFAGQGSADDLVRVNNGSTYSMRDDQ